MTEVIQMTIQQQAYGLIDRLSEDSIQVVIQVMKRMLPNEAMKNEAEESAAVTDSAKMKAYLRIQELRKISSEYDISENQRAAALDAKYGSLG